MKSAFMAYAKGTGGGLASINAVIISKRVRRDLNQTRAVSSSLFRRVISLFHTLRTVRIYAPAFLRICADTHKPKSAFHPHRTRHTQTPDVLREHSVDSGRQLCSPLLQCNNGGDFTLVSYSLTAVSSPRLPVVFPFEADLISHIRTSIFLKRAE